jgi:hypothetical protein
VETVEDEAEVIIDEMIAAETDAAAEEEIDINLFLIS